MKGKELDIKQLAELYLFENKSHDELAKIIGEPLSKIINELKKHNLFVETPKHGEIRKEHKKLKLALWDNGNVSIKKRESIFLQKESYYMAICKTTGEKFYDFTNSSGILTQHILKINKNFSLPTGFKRREVLRKTGLTWYYDFFDFIKYEKEDKKTLKCLECEFETTDIENKGGWFTSHIKNYHGCINEYLKKHPEHKILLNFSKNQEDYKNRYKDKKENIDFVFCKICGERVSKINNKHLSKHSLTLVDYKIKYGLDGVSSENFTNKIKTIYDGGLKKYESKNQSSGQKELYEFVKQFDTNCKLNDKAILSGSEIDIALPSFNIAIEYNGLYYHSENSGNKPRSYHLDKQRCAEKVGYRLIHVFEDEWIHKKDIVKNKICSIMKLDRNIQKIHARKCEIKTVSSIEKNNFLNSHHIQGEDRSTIHYGAYYGGVLISIITFDENRNMHGGKKTDEVELKRFAVHSSYSCVGIMQRFIKRFIKDFGPKIIMSFADKRWTLNPLQNVYTKNGFVLEKTIPQDFHYINFKISRNKRLSKYAFGKKKLKQLFPTVYDEKKSEWDIMQECGFDRIWDCGKLRYVLSKT